MHWSICNFNIWGKSPGIWTFQFSVVKFSSPPQKLFKCPKCEAHWMGKCPTPGPLFYHELGKIVSKQYAISTTVVGLFLKKKKKIPYLPSKATLSSYSPYNLVSHSVMNAISCPQKSLNIFMSLVFGFMMTTWMISQIPPPPPFRGLVSNSPPSSSLKVKCPTPGEREGVKCLWYAKRGGSWAYKLISAPVQLLRGLKGHPCKNILTSSNH